MHKTILYVAISSDHDGAQYDVVSLAISSVVHVLYLLIEFIYDIMYQEFCSVSVHGAVMYSTFGIFGLEVIAALMLIIAVYKVIVH